MTPRAPEIVALENEILEKKKQLAELRRAHREEIGEFVFDTLDGPKSLAELFGDKNELVIVHNMGRHCNYCSLWADGFSGFYKHIATRAAFYLASADPVDKLAETKEKRGWTFPVASNGGSGFAAAMNMQEDDGSVWPGISAFVKEDGKVYRYGYTYLGDGDDFCSIWHVWDLFPAGHADWSPK